MVHGHHRVLSEVGIDSRCLDNGKKLIECMAHIFRRSHDFLQASRLRGHRTANLLEGTAGAFNRMKNCLKGLGGVGGRQSADPYSI